MIQSFGMRGVHSNCAAPSNAWQESFFSPGATISHFNQSIAAFLFIYLFFPIHSFHFDHLANVSSKCRLMQSCTRLFIYFHSSNPEDCKRVPLSVEIWTVALLLEKKLLFG